MGYYIQFISKEIKLKKDTPIEVIEFVDSYVNHLNGKNIDTVSPPEHKLFTLERWDRLFFGQYSLDKQPYFRKDKDYWTLFIATEINYGREEIEEFAKWITPYVSGHKPKEFIGFLEGENRDDKYNIYITR